MSTFGFRSCTDAVIQGDFEAFKRMHLSGFPLQSSIYNQAAWYGRLDFLQYAFENECPVGGEATLYVTLNAAEAGHLDCLRFLHTNGFAWHPLTTYVAAEGGHLDCLQYAYENGCPLDVDTCRAAAHFGHLECLQYCHQQGFPWDTLTTSFAAVNGQLECLQYAHEHGCPWDVSTPFRAARNGHLTCLRFAHEHGCRWDQRTIEEAIAHNQLECLRFAHTHGCPWDENSTLNAARSGTFACLIYAIDNGCKYNIRDLIKAFESRNLYGVRLEDYPALRGLLIPYLDTEYLNMSCCPKLYKRCQRTLQKIVKIRQEVILHLQDYLLQDIVSYCICPYV